MKNKILFSIILLFICIVNVEAKSVSCEYDLITISIDGSNKITTKLNRAIPGAQINSTDVTYLDFVKTENGKQVYWCPPKIKRTTSTSGGTLVYSYSFTDGQLEMNLTNSTIDNSDSIDNSDAPTILRQCKYSGFTVYYYSDKTAKITNSNGKEQNFNLNGKDIRDFCPNTLYVDQYEGTFGASFTYFAGATTIPITNDNTPTYDPSNFDDDNEKDKLPITAIDFCSPVSADGTPNYTLLVFQVIGYIIIIIKILVPIILIVLGSIDLGKATVSGDDKIIMEKAVKFGMRVLTGVIIFFIPTILDFFLSLVSGVSETMANYRPCTNCIFYPNSKCNARKFNSTTPNDDGSNNKNNKDNINNPTVEIK